MQGLKSTKRDNYGRLILGDIITSVNGKKISNGSDLYRILDQCKVGDKVYAASFISKHYYFLAASCLEFSVNSRPINQSPNCVFGCTALPLEVLKFHIFHFS